MAVASTKAPTSRITGRRLRDGDELSGRHEAPLGVVPADQRLHGDDLVGAQRHLGLVVQDQLAPVRGAPERVLHLGPTQGPGLHLLVEAVDRAAAVLLGHLARGLGLAQELVGAHLAGAGDPDADGGREEQLDAGRLEGRLEGLDDPRGHRPSDRRRRGRPRT